MNDPLMMQAMPLIEPLIQQIYRLSHIVYGLHRLEKVLFCGSQLGKLAANEAQGDLSEAGVIFDIICRISMH